MNQEKLQAQIAQGLEECNLGNLAMTIRGLEVDRILMSDNDFFVRATTDDQLRLPLYTRHVHLAKSQGLQSIFHCMITDIIDTVDRAQQLTISQSIAKVKSLAMQHKTSNFSQLVQLLRIFLDNEIKKQENVKIRIRRILRSHQFPRNKALAPYHNLLPKI